MAVTLTSEVAPSGGRLLPWAAQGNHHRALAGELLGTWLGGPCPLCMEA